MNKGEIAEAIAANVERGCVATGTGKRILLLEPDPALITIEEIAGPLARLNRWGAQSDVGVYTVGQHSIEVCDWLSAHPEPGFRDPVVLLEGLLHDAHEAYLGDWIRPLKRLPQFFDLYMEIETRWQRAIIEALGLKGIVPDVPMSTPVAAADDFQLSREAACLFGPDCFPGRRVHAPAVDVDVAWRTTRDRFLARYRSLRRVVLQRDGGALHDGGATPTSPTRGG